MEERILGGFLVTGILSLASGVASDRAIPEDAVRVLQTDELVAFVVADGAGGLGGGARAARLVVEAFEKTISRGSSNGATPEMWCEFLLRLDAEVLRDSDAGESTAVVAVVRDNEVVGASVGDSEAWVVGSDDTWEIITSAQHKSRLGSGRASPVGFRTTVRNGILLAATDGLFHAARADAIRAALLGAPTPEKLVASARSRSGKLYDDVGVVVVTFS